MRALGTVQEKVLEKARVWVRAMVPETAQSPARARPQGQELGPVRSQGPGRALVLGWHRQKAPVRV